MMFWREFNGIVRIFLLSLQTLSLSLCDDRDLSFFFLFSLLFSPPLLHFANYYFHWNHVTPFFLPSKRRRQFKREMDNNGKWNSFMDNTSKILWILEELLLFEKLYNLNEGGRSFWDEILRIFTVIPLVRAVTCQYHLFKVPETRSTLSAQRLVTLL